MPSVIPAQAGITNHLCPSTSTPTRRPHAPQPPTPSPVPHHPRRSCSPPSFLRRQESRTTSAHQHQHPPGVPTHPSRQLPLPSPISLRHSCPPSVIPAQAGITNHFSAHQHQQESRTTSAHPNQASPRTPAANSRSLPLSPSVTPAPPPSFLRRQESRTTSAHQHQLPPGVPTHPSRQLPLPSPITLRHSCPTPSFLRRQESRTTSAHQHQHPPGVPTHPSHQLPLPSPITLRHSCPPPSFLRRQEPRTTRRRPLQARNPPTRPHTHKTQAATPVHHQIPRARHPLESSLIGQIDTDPSRSIPCPRDRLLDGR